MELARQTNPIFAGFRLCETITLEREHVAHELPVLVIVLDDEN